MLAALIVVALALASLVLSRLPQTRGRLRSCCSARPWPPDDLTGDDR